MKIAVVSLFALVGFASPAFADFIYGADWGRDGGTRCSCNRNCLHHARHHAGSPSPFDYVAFRHYWLHHGCDFDNNWGGLPCHPAG